MKGKDYKELLQVRRISPRNRRELKEVIINAWISIELRDIRKLILNLPQKMEKILSMGGRFDIEL